jgi:23S rRNA pseudouridine1911/1915/1917 synthase
MNSTDLRLGPHVLHADAHLCAVCKPAGMPVQPDPTGDVDLQQWVRDILADGDLTLAHRLDRPVSGVVLLARNAEALRKVNALFRDRQVSKTYLAIVEGQVQEDDDKGPVLVEHVLRHDTTRKRTRVLSAVKEGATASRLRYWVLARGDRYTLLRVVPEGGVFHQIRAQLAAAGHPIKGDVKYGARRGGKDRSIALHAHTLSFVHPTTGADLLLTAPPPDAPIWTALLAKADAAPM